MALIYETPNFVVESIEKPHIDRNDGGHVMTSPKVRIVNRQQLTPKQAIEIMRLTMVVGEAMFKSMNKNGVDVGRINYQDNGNWKVFKPEGPYFHIHIYGRAKSAKYNKYGQALYFPFMENHPEHYKDFKPLNKKDVRDMAIEIKKLLKEKKYSDTEWGLN